jgi:hypothetical protein
MKLRILSGTAGPPSFQPELWSCRMVRRDSGKQSRSATRMDTPSRSWSDNLSELTTLRRIEMKQLNRVLPVFAVLALLVTVNSFAAKMDMHTSSEFQGPKANTGTVTHYVENGKSMLKVSDDFKVPDTPAPTWRVVDSKGVVYTLDAFQIKSGNNEKRVVVVPSYVPNIAKVQVYCAWAEVFLGEASFSSPVK